MRNRRLVPPPPRKTRRRWRVPPAITHGPESLEGTAVLRELPSGLGGLFWQAIRDISLWASVQGEERSEVFAPSAAESRAAAVRSVEVPGELEHPFSVLARLLEKPRGVSEEAVMGACEEISAWADREGALATALAFAQAAALAQPRNAAASFRVGQLARRRAEHARAETWFRRTVGLARQSGDWASYSLAFLGLGVLYIQRGNFPSARRFLIRSLRAAKRHSLHEIAGCAYHDLFVVATETGQNTAAQEYARQAYREYGPRDSRVPRLAHDVAYFWMTQGHFERSLGVFNALLPHFERPLDRLFLLAGIARAGGGAGDREAVERVWEEASSQAAKPELVEGAAQALLDMARGAASVNEWERAEEAAERSLALAVERNAGHIRLTAESVLEAVRSGRALEVNVRAEPDEAREQGDALAEEFVRSLTLTAA